MLFLVKLGIIVGILLVFVRFLGEFGVILMLVGSIFGKIEIIFIVIFFVFESGNMKEVFIWVLVILVIFFGVIISVNFWLEFKIKKCMV